MKRVYEISGKREKKSKTRRAVEGRGSRTRDGGAGGPAEQRERRRGAAGAGAAPRGGPRQGGAGSQRVMHRSDSRSDPRGD